jgi:hypothetical protein
MMSVLAGMPLAACSMPDSPRPSEGANAETEAVTYARTIVRATSAGPSVRTVYITADEKAADLEARRARGRGEILMTAVDTSCAGSSMWLFDGLDLGGNEICFFGPPGAYLGSYPDPQGPSGTWASAVRSFWAGSESGYFQWGNVDQPQFQSFGAYELSTGDVEAEPNGYFEAYLLYLDNPPPPAPGPLAGSFVYFGDGTASDNPLPEAQMSAFLTNVQYAGMNTLVLENSRTHGSCGTTDYHYLPEMPSKLGTLLSEASALGMKAYLSGTTEGDLTCAWATGTNQTNTAADWQAFAKQMESAYGGESSFAGWYIPVEPPIGQTNLYGYYKAIVDAIHAAGSNRPILVSPFLAFVGPSYPPATVAQLAASFGQQTGVDIQVWQDSVGAQGIAAGWASKEYGSTDSYYAALAQALPVGGLWADVELFTCCVDQFGFGGGNYRPASSARLNQQLWNARHAAVRVSWLLQEHIAGPPIPLALPESPRLRDAYLALYGLSGHAVKPVGYTWTNPPASQYPDPGNTKLIDTITGDPLDFTNPAWTGIVGDAEIVVNLGSPTAVKWVAVELLRSKAPSITYPTSLAVDCDATGSNAFVNVGSWPLPLTTDADGEYVLSNASPMSVTCTNVRIHLTNAAWTFLSEVELTGP